MNREQMLFELAALDVNTNELGALTDKGLADLLKGVKRLTAWRAHCVDPEAAHEMAILDGMKVCPFCRARI